MKGMRKTIAVMIFLLALSTSAAFSFTGEAGPPMLKMVYGSRALGMGGAFSAVSDDVYYIDSNPAGGNVQKVSQLSLLHQEWIEDTNYEAIRFSRGLWNRFFIGFGFTYLYIPFTYFDECGYDSGASALISQGLGVLNLGYKLSTYDITIGTNLKVLYNNVPSSLLEARYGSNFEDQNYLLFAGDLGILARTDMLKNYIGPEPSLSFGLVLKNVGYCEVIEKLPTEVHAGISYRPIRPLLISVEGVYPLFEPVYGAFGAEYDFWKKLFIQGGVMLKENPVFSVGVGYKRRDLEINISYSPSLAFHNMVSVSLNFFIGSTEEMERQKRIEAYMIVALEYFGEKKYDEAMEFVARVLELDPKNKRALGLKETIEKKKNLKEKVDNFNNGLSQE